jgi:hypothetical protein
VKSIDRGQAGPFPSGTGNAFRDRRRFGLGRGRFFAGRRDFACEDEGIGVSLRKQMIFLSTYCKVKLL